MTRKSEHFLRSHASDIKVLFAIKTTGISVDSPSQRNVLKILVKSPQVGLRKCMSYLSVLYKPPHDKTNKMICAQGEDSDQPGHLPSLIRVFAVRSMGS